MIPCSPRPLSDDTQFLMERDHASLQLRQNALKMGVFSAKAGVTDMSLRESQCKKADLQGF